MTAYPKIPYEAAVETTLRNKAYAKWPSRRTANRLEPEAWPGMHPSFRIKPGSTIFTIGSCFARNIENYFYRLGFHIPTLECKFPADENPVNGILNKYTPAAIHAELDWTARMRDSGGFDEAVTARKLIQLSEDGWADANLVFGPPVTFARAMERRRHIYKLFLQAFTADVVTITLGLIEAWWDNVSERYIDIMPSRQMADRDPGRYEFRVLSYEDSLDFICKSIDLLNAGPSRPNILLTTSPIPLERTFTRQDVLIANCHSKSLLRTVAATVSGRYDNVDYFPSYEIVTLTKSPNIFIDDLIHVTEPFVGRIVMSVYKAYVDVPPEEVMAATIAEARAACSSDRLEPARELLRRGVDAASLPADQRSSFAYLKARVLYARGEMAELAETIRQVDWHDLIQMELLHFGKMQIAAGDPAAAIPALLQAMADCHFLAARYLMIECLPYAEDGRALLLRLRQILVEAPLLLKDAAQYWVALGVLEGKIGDIAESWKALRNARRYAPTCATLRRMVEELESQLQQGTVEQRIAYSRDACWHENLTPARQLVQDYRPDQVPAPLQPVYWYLRARIATDEDQFESLSGLLAQIDPAGLDGGLELLFLGKMYSDGGDSRTAERFLTECLRKRIAAFIACQLLITRCLDASANADALKTEVRETLERCHTEDPAAYWFTTALLQQHEGQRAAARHSALKAAELEPDHAWYVGLAESLADAS